MQNAIKHCAVAAGAATAIVALPTRLGPWIPCRESRCNLRCHKVTAIETGLVLACVGIHGCVVLYYISAVPHQACRPGKYTPAELCSSVMIEHCVSHASSKNSVQRPSTTVGRLFLPPPPDALAVLAAAAAAPTPAKGACEPLR